MTVQQTIKVPKFLGEGIIGWGEKLVPGVGPGQLLVQVKANALCASDRGQFMFGSEITPGHEAAGIVVEAGSNTHIAVGTPGVIFLMDFCGECRSCKLGLTNQCLHKRGDMGFSQDGGYGPYMLVNENIFFPIDSELPFSEATMLLDVMGTGGHAINRARLVHPDIQSLLIAGSGPIGLGVLAMAKIIFGFELPVFIIDFIPYRLELAQRMGALPILLKEQSLEEGLKKYGFAGIDAAIDTSGKTSAREFALHALNKRGVLICVGHGEALHLEISNDMIAPERAVLGSEYFQMNELQGNLKYLHQHLPYLSQIITHRFGVAELQHAYELFFKGNTGKVIIEQ
jgi:threonine 3-dehydrogenase